MKIIHCADLHLDSKMTTNFTKEKANSRKSELLNTFNRMIEYADVNQVNAIIIAGDLFDTKRVSASARNTVYAAICNHPQIDFYYLKGNHDADNFLSNLEEIPQNLKMFADEWTTYIANNEANKNIIISGIELNKDNSKMIYNSLTLDNDKFNIVVLHGQESENVAKDKAENISIKDLRNKGIDYLALGHIHTYKYENLDSRGKYCYSGCLEGRGFDEVGEHGFAILDIDEEKRTCEHKFVPIAYRNLYELEVEISGCMETTDISDRIKFRLEQEEIDSKDLLKIILIGEVDVECEKNIDLLVKSFEEGYYLLKIYDESKLKVDYNSFALDRSLKGEFVRTVMSNDDIADEDKATIIRYGIQALAGEEIQ